MIQMTPEVFAKRHFFGFSEEILPLVSAIYCQKGGSGISLEPKEQVSSTWPGVEAETGIPAVQCPL